MHIELQTKIENYQYLCHSTSIEYAKEILQNGYAENIYATIDSMNDYQKGCQFIFTIDKEEIEEDPCMEGSERCEKEWDNHNQVFLSEMDFTFNAKLIKIITDNDELNQMFIELMKQI